MDYTQITAEQRTRMLEAIGVADPADLFRSMPKRFRLERPLNLPPALSELELQAELARRLPAAGTTADLTCFMGGGAYDHFIPTVVNDVAGKGEFLTAYTPYQAEASQGSLQAFFEFQTQVARLTGLDAANASLYDGATAAAEAVFMALNVTGKRRVIVSAGVHPQYRAVLRTSCSDLPVTLIELEADAKCGLTPAAAIEAAVDDDTAAVVVQSPNVFGLIEDWAGAFAAAKGKGALSIAVFNPIAAALLKRPGSCGADVAVGEGQPLGIPLQYGGPWLGLFAARSALMRKMPGRLIGQTTDKSGRRAFCLTLQTREQHIRGAKATSNMCTNQGLLAIRATTYLTLMGASGLRGVAERCWHKAHHAARLIARLPGYCLPHGDSPFFHEFVVNCPVPAERIVEAGRKAGSLPGVPLRRLGIGGENQLLIAVTEKRTAADIDRLVALLAESRSETR